MERAHNAPACARTRGVHPPPASGPVIIIIPPPPPHLTPSKMYLSLLAIRPYPTPHSFFGLVGGTITFGFSAPYPT